MTGRHAGHAPGPAACPDHGHGGAALVREAAQPAANRAAVGPALVVDLAAGMGGAEVRVAQLVRGLGRQGVHAVPVVLDGGMLAGHLRGAGVPVLPVRRRRGDPRTLHALYQLFRAHRPAVVDAHNVQSQLWGLLAATAARVPRRVATVHSQYRTEHAGRRRARPYELVLRLARRLGCSFVAVSGSVEAYLLGLGIPRARIALVPNAVEAPQPPPPGSGAALRDALGIPPGALVALTAARLEPIKGHRHVLAALGAERALDRVHWLVAGDGRERAALAGAVDAAGLAGRVHLLGFRSDVDVLLDAADLVLAASDAGEGLPYALLEAAAAGVPVVTSRSGGVTEVFDDDTAVLFEPGSAEAVAKALRRALEAPGQLQPMAERARRAVLARCSPEQMVGATLGWYTGAQGDEDLP